MLEIFSLASNAVFPIILMIALGYILKKVGFLTPEFLRVGNRLVFRVALPVMLFLNVYGIGSFADIRFDAVLYACAVILFVFLLGWLLVLLAVKERPRRGALWQCFYRSNFVLIGLVLASALGGNEAEGVAAVLAAFVVPLFNILAVISLSLFVSDEEHTHLSFGNFFKKIVKNPLIIGALVGLFALGIRTLQTRFAGQLVFSLERDIPFLFEAMSMLKEVATPLALIILGGQFEFSAVRGMKKEIVIGTVGRLIAVPIIGIGGAVLLTRLGVFSFGVNEFPSFVALFGSPVAVSSAVMASEMKNDAQLATQLLVWTSIFSALTVFLTVCLLMHFSLLAL